MKAGNWRAAASEALVFCGIVVGVSLMVESNKAQAPMEVASAFDAEEAAYIHQTGEGTVEGRIFVRLWSGQEVPCTDQPVLLVPQTTLSRERMAYLYGVAQEPALRRHVRNPVKLEMPDPKYWDYMREAPCGQSGVFRFEGLADGDYFVVGSLAWKEENGWIAVSLMQPVQVEGGQPVHVILTPRSET